MDKIEQGYSVEPHVHTDLEARHLDAPMLQLDLAGEVASMRGALQAGSGGHVAKTLAKYDDLRILLVAFEPGGRLARHQAQGRVSIQVLEGQVTTHLGERTVELRTGGILVLEPNVAHEVEAYERSALLVSISWPGAAAVHPPP